MKKFLYLLAVSVIIYSCGKEDLKYSCNAEINAIVKSAKIEFSKLVLTEFLEYDIELQKAIFRSFSNEKKREFWLEKLNTLLLNGEYSDYEKKHIEKLITHITVDYFEVVENDSLKLAARIKFENDWKFYALNTLNWDEPEIHFIVNSLCITPDQYAQTISELKEITLNYMAGNCTCSTESDYCSDIGGFCTVSDCTETSACGWVWSYTCDGHC